LTFVCAFIAGIVGTAGYLHTRPKVFQSTATILVHPEPTRAAEAVAQRTGATAAPAQTALSRPLLVQLLERLPPDVREDGIPTGDAPDRVAALRVMLGVVEVAEANMLELSARGPDPDRLQQIVGHWVEVYLEHDASLRSKTQDSTDRELSSELGVLEQRIEEKRNALETFRQRHDIQSMQREENVVASRLAGLNATLNKARERMGESEGHLQSLHRAIAAGQPVGTQQEWRALVQLEGKATDLRTKAKELESKYTARYIALNPEMQAVGEQLAVVEADIARKREEITREAVFAAEQDLASAERTVQTVELELDQHKRRSQEFSTRFSEFESLEQELEELESRARETRQGVLELDIARRDARPTPELLEGASLPTFPISPDYLQVAGIGLGASLVLALLAVWIRDYLSRPDTVHEAGASVHYSLVDARSLGPGDSPALPAASRQAIEGAAALLGIEPRELAEDEVERLLDAADESTAILIMLLLSGLTATEAAALRWRDLTPEHQTIAVGGDEGRVVPVPRRLRLAIERHAGAAAPDSHLWCDPGGSPLAEEELDALITYAAHDAQLPGPSEIGARTLRHTHLADLVRRGAPLPELERLVGYLAPSEKMRYRALAPTVADEPSDPSEIAHPAVRRENAR
jgi:uncharacterized protein involved in exopolysaccharide biosynthesis